MPEEIVALSSLISIVLGRGLLFAVGFAAGCFTMLFIWLLYKVVPSLNTYVMLVSSYDKFLKREKGYRISLFSILFIMIAMLFIGLLIIYVVIR